MESSNTSAAQVTVQSPPAISTELAMRNTGMAFQRTRMGADRTLMAVIRTSLSLISFGFTIYQVFNKLKVAGGMGSAAPARNFGVALVLLGVGMLILGISYHVFFMLGLRDQRRRMKAAGILYGESTFPTSLTLIVALSLLLIGFLAIAGLVLHAGPFG